MQAMGGGERPPTKKAWGRTHKKGGNGAGKAKKPSICELFWWVLARTRNKSEVSSEMGASRGGPDLEQKRDKRTQRSCFKYYHKLGY